MAHEITARPTYTLYVYYTRYSSWGARVQLVLEYFQIPHQTSYFNYTSPSLRPPPDLTILPVLENGDDDDHLRIQDSLAICEYLADQHPEKSLWPKDIHLRALARSAAAQMHSSFAALRDAYATNFVAHFEGPGIPFDDATAKDVDKLLKLWGDTRVAAKRRLERLGEEDRDEGFLCGGFSIADAFFWPVLWRLRTYNVPLAGISEEAFKWMETMWNHPVMKEQGREYFRQAEDPRTQMPIYDDIFKDRSDVIASKFTKEWAFTASAYLGV